MIGKRLKKSRISAGLTQQQLAEKIGISRSTISKYELNKAQPSLKVKAKLCLCLDNCADFLLATKSQKDNKVSAYSQPFSPEEMSNITELIKEWASEEYVLFSNRKNKNYAFLELQKALNKSLPKTVTEALVYSDNNAFFVCPNCKFHLETEYQAYCDICGQRLKWISLKKVKYIQIKPPKHKNHF